MKESARESNVTYSWSFIAVGNIDLSIDYSNILSLFLLYSLPADLLLFFEKLKTYNILNKRRKWR